MVTRTRHNVTFYVHDLSCFSECFGFPSSVSFHPRFILLFTLKLAYYVRVFRLTSERRLGNLKQNYSSEYWGVKDRKALSRNKEQKVIKLAMITVMKICHISFSCWFLQYGTATHTCFHKICARVTQHRALTIPTTSTAATLPTL
jgi:hypothetical protein